MLFALSTVLISGARSLANLPFGPRLAPARVHRNTIFELPPLFLGCANKGPFSRSPVWCTSNYCKFLLFFFQVRLKNPTPCRSRLVCLALQRSLKPFHRFFSCLARSPEFCNPFSGCLAVKTPLFTDNRAPKPPGDARSVDVLGEVNSTSARVAFITPTPEDLSVGVFPSTSLGDSEARTP